MSENLSNINHDEEEICSSQPISLPSSKDSTPEKIPQETVRPPKYKGQKGSFRSIEEIDAKYRHVFTYPYFNLVQSSVIDDALYSNKSMVVCAPTGSGKTVIFEMAILQLLMEREDKNKTDDFKIIYMAPVKALCTERITEWYSKFTKLGLLCIEVTGDTDVDFPQLKPYRIIITTPEKWDMLTRRWMEHNLVKVVKLFLIDEVHILNDESRGPVLEAVVSRMKTVESSARSSARLVAVSASISNPQDVSSWLGAGGAPAVHYKFGDECRPVTLTRVVEGYPCSRGTSIFKFDIILNYKLWPIIQKYYNGKPTLIFCNTRKSVMLTAETLSREVTVGFSPEQRGKLTALASTIKNKKIQSLVLSGVGCHHAGLLLQERTHIELAFRNRDLPILVTTTTLAMGVNLPAHLVIVKNTQQYVNGAYQEYSISTVLQMVGRAGRPQYDLTATAVIMTRLQDKARYQSLVDGSEPLQSFLHKRLAENINSEIALGTIGDVAQCVQWLNSTFLKVRAARDPKRYLGLPQSAPAHLITKKIEELCVKAMNGLESSGLVTMDELSCIESTEAGRLMSLHYLDLETMKLIMKIEGIETLDRLLWLVCESHELSDMHLRVDERRCLNALNRNNSAPTIRYPMKGKINSRQMKLNCIIQSVLGCLPIPDPSLNQEALKIMRTADRICKCLVSYVTRPNLISQNPKFYTAILNSLILAKCITAHLWENSVYVSRQLKGIGPTFSTLLASAGKTNFMLLDESHPRDLERIMNKSPPAGNVLRKQISLLPKYNVTIIPINEQSIRVQLSLLNQSYLAENIDSLTAGARHKSYIVVGDSENFLLYFSSFNDSDLINIYDGSMNFDVNRKHLNEHKVIAHCVSSSIVGIDNQCEYVFKDINPFPLCIEKTSLHQTTPKISPNRQTYITDIFKERKRKNNDSESTSFKEKKKRDGLLIDKFKTLNKTFEKTSKDIKEKCNETKVPIIGNLVNKQSENTPKVVESNVAEVNYEIDENDFLDDFEYEDVDNERINKLLNEIEGEVNNPSTSKCNSIDFRVPCKNDYNKNNSKTFNRDKVNMNKKNNYTFIEKLEKKNSEYDSDNLTNNKESGFCNTIKSNIQQYLEKAQNNIKSTIMDVIDLQEKGIDTKNLITSLENKEIVHYNIVNPENIDLTKIIEEDQNIITKMNISKENVEIIDLTSISLGTTNNNKIKSPDKSKTSPKTRKTLLENIEFDVTHIEKEEHALKTNADTILCNIEDKDNLRDEYFFKPNVPLILNSKPINNHQPITPKPKTSTNSYNIKPRTSSSTSENLKQSGTFPAECALKRFEKNPEESKSKNTKELETYQKPLNVYSSLVEEKFEDLNESCLLSIHSEHNNSQLNTQNLNTGTKFRDIKKYSFNSTKTIGFRKENISKICTLKVALDVTELVHNEDNFDPQNDDFNKNSQNIKEQNILSHMDKKGTVLQIEDNIRKSLTTSNNEKTLLNQELEITKPPSEISDKSTINAKLKNKKTTLIRDILNRYKRNTMKQNNTKLEETVLETCKTQEDKNIKKPEFKQKRKYRISEIDTIDITLPESLIPSQSQVINKTPNYINNDKIQYQSKSITDEEPKPSTVIENTDALFVGKTSCNDIDEEVENKYDEELKINLNSYLDEPVIFSNLDLNTDVLDPKTLLQSLNNDEIIPPPPEFCDDYIYSPGSSLDLDTSKVIDLNSDDLHNANTLPNDNIIFEKTFVDLLQCSKKTDTWVLSRKDSDCSMSDHNSSYDTRVYRSHDESNESGFLKSKLSQYRFKRRNTLMK